MSTIKTASIELALIAMGPNVREDENSHIAELAQGLKSAGQMQPIRVCEIDCNKDSPAPKWLVELRKKSPDAKYVPAFGHRRVLAARSLGWKTITAEVMNAWTESQRQQWQATENLQRKDLTPVEECLAVATMIDIEEERGTSEVAAHSIVGEKLGRSAAWVRDRSYVARLGGEARALLAAGRLPLGHAREIAKLAGPAMRDHIAVVAARDKDGMYGKSLEWVRNKVARQYCSLKVIPWKMDQAVGGKPACDTCPCNSANSPDLFENDEEQPPESGVCLLRPCFEHKTAEAQKALEAVTRKAAAGKTPAAPEFIKVSSYQRAVAKAKGQQDEKPKDAGGDDRTAARNSWDTPERRARDEHAKLVRVWASEAHAAIEELKNPLVMVAFEVLATHEPSDPPRKWLKEKTGKLAMAMLRAAKDGDAKALMAAIVEYLGKCNLDNQVDVLLPWDSKDEDLEAMSQLLLCVGAEAPELPPSEEKLLEKHKPAAKKPAAAKELPEAARGEKQRKKSGKRPAKAAA